MRIGGGLTPVGQVPWNMGRIGGLYLQSRTVDVFHGTCEWAAKRILKHGLQPDRDCGRVYVTTSTVRAGFYAAVWTAHFMSKHQGRDRGAIICFRVPRNQLVRNPDDWDRALQEYVIRGALPASAIAWHKIEPLGIDLADSDMRGAVQTVQESLDTGIGGIRCPAGCGGSTAKRRARCLVESALHAANPFARDSEIHGLEHWARVYEAALYLLEREPAADPAVVVSFAWFHDTQRLSDDRDPDHGARAAEVARRHHALSSLSSTQRQQLVTACSGHTAGQLSDDPTIGVCWDADRLNLWRLGRKPLTRFLSTETARDPETIEWARALQEHDLDDWLEACRKTYLSTPDSVVAAAA